MPKVIRGTKQSRSDGFPVERYTYSSLVKFCTNPVLFKVNEINRDQFETSTNISGVLGKAFHKALEVYYGGSDDMVVSSEAEAIKYGLEVGAAYLEAYNDGWINYSKTIPTKQAAMERFTFAFTEYIKEFPYEPDAIVSVEEKLEENVDIEWRGERLALPVKLTGRLDLITRKDGKLVLRDHKTCYSFSDPDKIDGQKMLQAVQYYLLAYAKYGEEPRSIVFDELKYTKNKDGGKQVRSYEVVYAENELFFDFYFRLYDDVTRALNGEQVYVPNLHALFDNEVALIAYIYRLDEPEEAANLMKKHKVQNLTELLKKQIHNASSMKKLLKSIEQKFTETKNIDYANMKDEEKIQTKLLEHGMMLQFDSKVEGATVDLYRYTPSIGLKMSKLNGYVADVEQVMGVSGIRVLAPIPNTSFVGFEVPRKDRTFPTVPAGTGFEVAIGQTTMGNARRLDIRTAPHLLVAGASGSGKSVFLNALIEQLSRIENAELFLLDPKRVELAAHKSNDHVVAYESDIERIHDILEELVDDMNGRYGALEKAGKRSIEQMPDMLYQFVVIDEFGDLIAQNYERVRYLKTGKVFQRGEREGEEEVKEVRTNLSKEIEKNILLLAQKARAAGIHVIIATQRPSTDVIKGTIKANFPTKVVFKTAKAVDSVVVLDEPGAEKLSGKGDMLFAGEHGIERLQGYNA